MRTFLLHRDDPYLLEFDAAVLERRQHGERPAVVLDRTAFYAEAGGQPWDTGELDGARVLSVLEVGGDILHVLERPLDRDRIRGRVDGPRRRDHRQQHHGQHLLSRALLSVARADTVSFHLGEEVSTIDLDRWLGEAELAAAESLANQVVEQARPVRTRFATQARALALGVRVPEGAGDEVRLVEADGFDLQACGGTHPQSTAEVGAILISGSERYKGGSRVAFLCGDRALGGWRARRRVLEQLSPLLSAPWPDLPAAAQQLKEQAASLERQKKELLGRALDGEARKLLATAAAAPGIVTALYDGWEPSDLRLLANRLVSLGSCVALLASRAGKTHLVFAQSEGLGLDLGSLLRRALEPLGGRGGGRGNLVQGGCDQAEGVEAVLAGLASELRSQSAPHP